MFKSLFDRLNKPADVRKLDMVYIYLGLAFLFATNLAELLK